MKGGENRNMRKLQRAVTYARQGFTLIELLVVVGIIAVLAVAALIAINPLEAQRRSRDAARLQDLARLSSVIEAYVNDNGMTGLPAAAVNSRGAGTGVRSQACGNNWLNGNSATAANFCPYIKQIPLDPVNARTINIVSALPPATTRANSTTTAAYAFIMTAATGDYKLCAYLEAEKNRELLNDGGLVVNYFETGTDLGLACGL